MDCLLGSNCLGPVSYTHLDVYKRQLHEHAAQAVVAVLNEYLAELRIAMFCSGCANIAALRSLTMQRIA